MANKKQSTATPDISTPALLPGTASYNVMARNLVGNGRPSTRAEQAISEQLRENLIRQMGIAIKTDHAERLTTDQDQRTLQHYDNYLASEEALLAQERSQGRQAELEAFSDTIRQLDQRSLVAIRQGAVDNIESIAVQPFDTSPRETEEVIIEHTPGLLGRIFGGQQVTRVKR
jgi:hypothetical protein